MTSEQEQFFTAMMDTIKEQCAEHPSISNLDCASILGRMIGMIIARSGNDREAIMKAVNENIVKAVRMFE